MQHSRLLPERATGQTQQAFRMLLISALHTLGGPGMLHLAVLSCIHTQAAVFRHTIDSALRTQHPAQSRLQLVWPEGQALQI